MPTTQELIATVQRKVMDASYTPELILSFLNKGLQAIAGWKNTNPARGLHGEILLPSLEVTATVGTEAALAEVDLPEDFGKNLYYVLQDGNPPPVITILSGLGQLLALNNGTLANSGTDVQYVTINGNSLVYQPIPNEPVTLELFYYKRPPTLTLEDPEGVTNTPSSLPDHLQEDLLANYAAMEIYGEIEDGLDGRKVQTEFYAGRFHAAMMDLYKSITHKTYQRILKPRRGGFF